MSVNANQIAQLYGTSVDAQTLEKIQEYAEGGFTNTELFELEELGVDISLIKNTTTATKTNAAAPVETKANTADVSAKVAELKAKYTASANNGDHYTSGNPQLKALKQAIDDGVIADLGNQGFDKAQIIDIISQVFPSVGIKGNADGSYSVPIGHDSEAQEIYQLFSQELMMAAGETEEMKALKAEIAGLNQQIADNNQQLQILKPMIEKVQKEVEDKIDQAIEDSEEIAEEQKEAAQKAVKEELRKYTSSDGEMSYEKFQSNLDSRLNTISDSGNSKLASVVRNLLDAEGQMSILKGYVSRMGDLLKSNQSLTTQVGEKTAELEQMKEELKDTEDPDCQKCDPIGFSDDNTRYDFFIDKDGDGNISNEKEFLGAQDGWNEMTNLDANNDNKITSDEMEGLKVVVTNADGTQEIKDANEIFKEGDSVNLNSYSSKNQDMDNGNTLLGTFNLTFNGEENDTGYQTLDRLDWLDENYNFSDKDNGINRFAQDKMTLDEKLDLDADYEKFQEKTTELETKLSSAWAKIGIERAEIKQDIEFIAKRQGEKKGQEIEEQFEKNAVKGEEPKDVEKEKDNKPEDI